MFGRRQSLYKLGVTVFLTTILLMTNTWAASEKKLHNFGNGTDGRLPNGPLILDAAGNLYGTTAFGGEYGAGIAFELVRNSDGSWTEKKLHNFGNGADGSEPYGGLVMDAAGNLYGVTNDGGDYYSLCTNGCGTVFELSPDGHGGWTEKKLHNFGFGSDGATPYGGLIFDRDGNLYGTAGSGGYSSGNCTEGGCGIVFELSPNGSGGWTEKKLYEFRNSPDGAGPSGALVFDAAGNLYGTTTGGGDYPYGEGAWRGTAYELVHMNDGH